MSEIRLTGSIGSHPLGALAAFGLLRVSSQISEIGAVRLSWERARDCWSRSRSGSRTSASGQLEPIDD